MDAIGYVRVSTEGQAVDGVSLETQRAKIKAWCNVNGYDLAGVYSDAGISGKRTDNRPGLQTALEAACKRKAALVVYSLSRLARSTKDALTISERLSKSNADLVSLSERIDTTSAAGKMVFRMLAVLAEFERDLVSERTTAAMAHLRQNHRRVSRHIPFGFDLGQEGATLIPNPAEQDTIRMMQSLRAEGKSLRDIVGILEARGIDSKMRRKWTPKVVSSILRRNAA